MADGPLAGRRIVVTRPRGQAGSLAEELEQLGATVLIVPLVEIAAVDDATELDHAVRKLGRYDWLVFTSVNGVAALRARLDGHDGLASTRVAAVGPATAAATRDLGAEPAYVPERFEASALAEGLGDLDGARVLLPQGDLASTRLAEELRDLGAIVDAVVAYKTVPRSPSPDEIVELRAADAVVVASGSAARSLAAVVERNPHMNEPFLVCIGPRTAEAVRDAGLPVAMIADEASTEGIIQTLTTHFGGDG